MKIAIICSSFFPVIDGVTIAIYERLKQLSSLGHQVIAFCPDYSELAHIYPDYRKYQGNILPGIEIVSLPSKKAIALDFERDVTINSYRLVIEQLSQFQPDIIHVDEAERLGMCWFKLPGVAYAQQHNIPCVAWYHTNYLDYLPDYLHLPFGLNKSVAWILKAIFAKIYNAYDATLVASPITANRVEQLGIRNSVCAELLGCNLARFNSVTKTANYLNQQYNLPPLDNKIKLIYLGRLTADKGWEFALDAFAELPDNLMAKIAIIIGGDGDLKSEITQRLSQLTPNCYLLGRIKPEAVPELLVNGDLFITNSVKETKGLTVIEAAATGISAIAPRAGGIINTIVDGETGLLYTPEDKSDFIDKLTILIGDRHLRKQMGAQAKQQAQQYDWETTVDNLITIWSQAIQKKSKSV